MTRKKLFISYSHRDARWLDRVREQLAVLESEGLIDLFEDTRIAVGEDWYARLDQEMLDARLALLLVSASFLTSAFIRKEEVPRLFGRHESKGLVLYPLLVRDCPWTEVPWLARLQIRPEGARPIASFRGAALDKCLADVAREIASIIKEDSTLHGATVPTTLPRDLEGHTDSIDDSEHRVWNKRSSPSSIAEAERRLTEILVLCDSTQWILNLCNIWSPWTDSGSSRDRRKRLDIIKRITQQAEMRLASFTSLGEQPILEMIESLLRAIKDLSREMDYIIPQLGQREHRRTKVDKEDVESISAKSRHLYTLLPRSGSPDSPFALFLNSRPSLNAVFSAMRNDEVSIYPLLGFPSEKAYKEFIDPSAKTVLTRKDPMEIAVIEYLLEKRTVTDVELLEHGFSWNAIEEVVNAFLKDNFIRCDSADDPVTFFMTPAGYTITRRYLDQS